MANSRQRSVFHPCFVVIGSCFCYGIGNSFAMCLNVFTESIVEWFHVSYKEASVIATLAYTMICACAPISRFFIEKFGLRLVMFVCGIVASISQMSCAFTKNFTVMVLLFGVTTGICFCTTATGTLLLSVYILEPKHQHIALAATSAGTAVGLVLQPLGMEALLELYGYPQCLLPYGAFALNVCVWASFFPPHLPTALPLEDSERLAGDGDTNDNIGILKTGSLAAASKKPRHNFHFDILCTWRFWAVNLTAAVFGLLQTIMGSFNMSILEQRYGIEPTIASIIVSVGGGVNIIGRLSTSLFKKSTIVPRWWTWSLVNILAGFSLVLFGILDHFYQAVICQVLYTFTMGLSMTLYYVVTADVFGPDRYPAAISYGLSCWTFGILWTPMAGWLRDITESFTVPLLVFGGLLMGIAAIPLIGLPLHRMRRKMKPPDKSYT